MMQVQNTDAIKAIRDGAMLSISEGFPTLLQKHIQPVMDCTPEFHRRINIDVATSAGTLVTTPTDRDFYITGLYISFTKTGADTGTAASITTTIDGNSATIHTIGCINAQADAQSVFVPLQHPLKVDRGAAVTLAVAGGFTAIRAAVHSFETVRR